MTRQPTGFTLVELLVALSLFALISVASLALLRSSIDTQAALTNRIDQSAALERVRAMIADSLLSAQPQAVRGPGQAITPALTGNADGMRVASVMPGPDGVATIAQISLTAVDGHLMLQRGSSEPATLIDNLSSARFRYRDARGNWQAPWTPTQPDMLPRAVELTLQQRGGPDIVMRFIVAPNLPSPEAPVDATVPS